MSLVRNKAMENHESEDQGSTFWKKSTKPVPGRPSPRKEVRSNSQPNSSSTSFQDFQESVSDAWEIGDDEFCNILDMKISKQVVHSTALSVINSHRSKNSTLQSTTDSKTSGQSHNAKNAEISEAASIEEHKESAVVHHSPASRYNNAHRAHTKLQVAVGSNLDLQPQKTGSLFSFDIFGSYLESDSKSDSEHQGSNLDLQPQKTGSLFSFDIFGIFGSYLESDSKSDCEQQGSNLDLQPKKTGSYFSFDIFGIFGSYLESDSKSDCEQQGADSETMVGKVAKFRLLMESNLLNLEDLRHLSWSGIPVEVRPIAWRLLAGYLPASLERRQAVMERKRLDYWNLVKQYFDTERDETYQDTYRQIHIDIPRMSPLIALFQQKTVQEMFERILFIWAIRHPASGYVQGINDLVTPFYVVFLQEFLPAGGDLDTLEVNSLPKEHQDIIEADSFWCLSKFLDGIQDNYIFAQLGIQHKVKQLKELIQRIDGTLHKHLQRHGIDYLQFSFRWMNNLLTREIPLRCSIRLWDTYLAESDSFASFQLYVCAAFLLHWRQELLLERDFQGLMLMLQNLPTHNWTDADIGVLVAEAYRLKFTFADAPNHLQSNDNR